MGAQLQHENLVRIYDEGEAAGHLFLVMEYIDGKSVGHLIGERGALPAGVTARCGRQIARGLDHACQKGLLHRDVNPQNILIALNGTAKLTDMGLAIDLSDQGEQVTRDGATVGTFDYISPEQACSSRELDIRSDLYSLGCTLYHMLAGRVPFPHPTLPEKLYAHQALAPAPISSIVTDVPKGLEQIVLRLMAKSPENRYQTPADVVQALEPFQGPPMTLEEIESAPEVPIWIDAEGGNGPISPADEPTHENTAVIPDVPPPPDPPPAEGMSSDIFGVFTKIASEPITPLSGSVGGTKRLTAEHGMDRRLWLGVVGALLAAVAAAAFLWDPEIGKTGSGGQPPTTRKSGGFQLPPPPPPPPSNQNDLVTIRWLDDGVETPELSLASALQQAAGKRAEILVRDHQPLELTGDRSLVVSKGGVVLRAAEGTAPVVKVRWKGSAPVFMVRLDSSLKVIGLNFECDPEHSTTRTALFEATGDLVLERTRFTAPGPVHDMKVAIADGLRTTISGCVFQGIDAPLRFEVFTGAKVQLEQCLFLRSPGQDDTKGWAIVLSDRLARSDTKAHRLVVDRCTVVGSGLMALEDFTPDHRVEIEVRGTVVQGPALLAWTGASAFPSGLRWLGSGNRYDLKGPAWVLRGPGTSEGIAKAPTDLPSWCTATAKEPEPRPSGSTSRAAARNPSLPPPMC